MEAKSLPAEVIELVTEHLSVDADDLIVECSTDDVATISGRWNECVRDLGHLPREERNRVLQRSAPFRPQLVAGCNVTLYSDVQVLKGQPRVAAAIVDCGDRRYIVMG